MPTITGYTAERMKEIEDSAIVDGDVIGDNLILKRFDAGEINAGNVRGIQGIQGPVGQVAEAPSDGKLYSRRNGLWVEAFIPHSDTVKVVANGGTSSSTIYVNLPTRCFITNFVKQRADTKLIVTLHGGQTEGGYITGTGVDIGGVDTDLTSIFSNSGNGFHSGIVALTGIAAGTIANIEIQWKRINAVIGTQYGIWSMSVTESF